MVTATTEPVRLPPGPRLPKTVQGVWLLTARYGAVAALGRRYGSEFTVKLPFFGQTVVVSDPVLVKETFSASRDLIGRPTNNLSGVLGEGSVFGLEGEELLARRKLLLPPFHGKGMRSYEPIVEEEVMREIASWPEGREFGTVKPMMRITLNTILRAVFGAEGPALDELKRLMPSAVALGSAIAFMPSVVRRDLGPWSPGGRFLQYRRQVDAVIYSLIAQARADSAFEDRRDVLALLLQARYENGEPISDQHIADELLTMLVAGHETTSIQLAWTVERLRRHPRLLSRLTDEVDAGGSDLRQATIWESQRVRPVLTAALRRTKTRIQLGNWVIPENTTVMVSIQLTQASEENFPDAASFDPGRFEGGIANPFAWIAFGGGMNRCVGAGLANMEMDVVLRTLLRELRFEPTAAPEERFHSRGVAVAPGRGGRAVIYRRKSNASTNTDTVSAADHGSA